MKTERQIEIAQQAAAAWDEHARTAYGKQVANPYAFVLGYVTALKASQWIDVNERKPDKQKEPLTPQTPVLVYTDTKDMFVGYYVKDDQFECEDGSKVWGITHWQPLPNPPEA